MKHRAVLMATLLVLSSAATAQAQAAAAARPADVVGRWEFTVDTPQGANVMTVTFARTDGELTGNGEGQFGAFPLADVVVSGNDLSFALRIDQVGQQLDIPFKGKVTSATAAEGTITFAMGGDAQTMAWKARRLPPG